jgi:hypothetical protein
VSRIHPLAKTMEPPRFGDPGRPSRLFKHCTPPVVQRERFLHAPVLPSLQSRGRRTFQPHSSTRSATDHPSSQATSIIRCRTKETTRPKTSQPVLGILHPKRPIRFLVNADDVTADDIRVGCAAEETEARPIKPQDSSASPYPQIAVMGLAKGEDPVYRQAVVSCPLAQLKVPADVDDRTCLQGLCAMHGRDQREQPPPNPNQRFLGCRHAHRNYVGTAGSNKTDDVPRGSGRLHNVTGFTAAVPG